MAYRVKWGRARAIHVRHCEDLSKFTLVSVGVPVAGQSVPLFLSLFRLSVALFCQVLPLLCSVGFQGFPVLPLVDSGCLLSLDGLVSLRKVSNRVVVLYLV